MWRVRVAIVLAFLSVSAIAVPASAGGEVERWGSCSRHADWTLKVKPDDGRLEVEAEVDSGVNGQTWRWRMLHNGSLSARGRSRTGGRSGSFDVERRMTDLAGKDTFRFRARHAGQVCRGAIRW